MAKRKGNTGRGVTANMLDLGSSDSGFESQRPDKKKQRKLFFNCRGEKADTFAFVWDSNAGAVSRVSSDCEAVPRPKRATANFESKEKFPAPLQNNILYHFHFRFLLLGIKHHR